MATDVVVDCASCSENLEFDVVHLLGYPSKILPQSPGYGVSLSNFSGATGLENTVKQRGPGIVSMTGACNSR